MKRVKNKNKSQRQANGNIEGMTLVPSSSGETLERVLTRGAGITFGKVEGAGVLPKDYKAPRNVVSAPGEAFDPSSFRSIFTTQPFVGINDDLADHPDGWTQCFLYTEAAKEKITSTPGFPQPLSKPVAQSYKIAATPDAGLGMFATRRLKMGELVASERPLMISPAAMRRPLGLPSDWDGSDREMNQAAIFEMEELVKVCFQRLEPEDQVAFMSLANCHTEDGSGPIYGRIRTNAIEVGGLEDHGPYGSKYVGVCKDLSRVNHSCNPNVTHHFDMASLSYQLKALRSIDEGEQLTISYVDPNELYKERAARLEPYGIKCNCKSCVSPTKSDDTRAKVELSMTILNCYEKKWRTNPSATRDYNVIMFCVKCLSLMEENELHALEQYYEVLIRGFNSAVDLGDEELAVNLGKLRVRTKLAHEVEKKEYYGPDLTPDALVYRQLDRWGSRGSSNPPTAKEKLELTNAINDLVKKHIDF